MNNLWMNNPFVAGQLGFGLGAVFALVLVWSLVWKGLALWESARKGH